MTIASTRLLDYANVVLFDLDGTLLDTAPDLVDALHKVCDEAGQARPPTEVATRYVSTGAIGLVKLAFPDLPATSLEPLRQQLVSVYENNLCAKTSIYAGMSEVLDALDARGARWGVVTNKLKYLAEPILDQLGLLHRCATVVGGDTAAQNKPHPAPIHFALAEMDARAENAVYIGDAEKDVQAGKAAGTRTVAVTWGYIIPGHDPHLWNADYTIDRPAELLSL